MSQYLHVFMMMTDRRKVVPCTVLKILFLEKIRVTDVLSFLCLTPAQQLQYNKITQFSYYIP